MFSDKEIKKIREHLGRAQNPIFFFDNDPDGLCSYLILARFIGRGKGVAIKSFPELNETYLRKVEELNGDYIFILDKPLVSEGFLSGLRQKNIPIVWIDHHAVDQEVPKEVDYYNHSRTLGESEPVTALCYQVSGRKEDLWIAVVGCISDGFFPPFYEEFRKLFPEMGMDSKDPFEILYKSKVGELASIFGSGLKDKTSNVVSMLKFLVKASGPYDVLEENLRNNWIHKRAKQVEKRYSGLLSKAKSVAKVSGKVLFFKYSGDLSVSGELSNQLKYLYPEKYIVVAYVNGSKVNLSLRGKGVKKFFLKAISGISGATGGGHEDAVGGQISIQDIDKFRINIEESLK